MKNIHHLRTCLQEGGSSLAPQDLSVFLAWGARQGVWPLAYLAARQALPLDPQTWAERPAYLAHCARVRQWQTALAEILQAFERAGVAALCFKGPALAENYWPNPLARSYADLDLLCPPQAFAKAEEALFGLGYGYYFSSRRESMARLERRKKVVVYRRGNTVLDLHHHLPWGKASGAHAVDGLLARAVSLAIAGQFCKTLAHEDCLVMLAWHGGKHLYHKLSQVLDVWFLLRNAPGLDWDLLLKTARRRKLEKSLALALELVRGLFGDDAAKGCPARALPDVSALAGLVREKVICSPRPEPGLGLALRVRAGQAQGLGGLAGCIYEKTLSPQFADVLHTRHKLPMPAYALCRLHRLITKGRKNA